MSKNFQIALLATVIIIVGIVIFKDRSTAEEDRSIYKLKLNTSPDPAQFGPSYWAGFHGLANKIPCGSCKAFAVNFMIFFHDLVNQKTGKSLYNPDNYNSMLQLMSDIKTGAVVLGPNQPAASTTSAS